MDVAGYLERYQQIASLDQSKNGLIEVTFLFWPFSGVSFSKPHLILGAPTTCDEP